MRRTVGPTSRSPSAPYSRAPLPRRSVVRGRSAAPHRRSRADGRAAAPLQGIGVDQIQIRFRSRSADRAVRPDRALRRRGRPAAERLTSHRPTDHPSCEELEPDAASTQVRQRPRESTCCWRGRSPSCRASVRAWGATSHWHSPARAPTSPWAPGATRASSRCRARSRRWVAGPSGCRPTSRTRRTASDWPAPPGRSWVGSTSSSTTRSATAPTRCSRTATWPAGATTIDVNLIGTLQLTQAVLPYLKEQDDSRIIMINSQSGQVMDETFGAYSASKAALEHGHQDAGPRARPRRRAGQRHPPELHLGQVGRVVHQPHGRGAGGRLPGGLRRVRRQELPEVPAVVGRDRRRRRVLRLAAVARPSPGRASRSTAASS